MQETQETWVQSLGWEDPLEEKMAPCSSILAWEIPWTEEPGGLQSVRSQSRTGLRGCACSGRDQGGRKTFGAVSILPALLQREDDFLGLRSPWSPRCQSQSLSLGKQPHLLGLCDFSLNFGWVYLEDLRCGLTLGICVVVISVAEEGMG